MNKTCKIAAAVIRWTLALLCLLAGSYATAQMVLASNDEDED